MSAWWLWIARIELPPLGREIALRHLGCSHRAGVPAGRRLQFARRVTKVALQGRAAPRTAKALTDRFREAATFVRRICTAAPSLVLPLAPPRRMSTGGRRMPLR